MMTTIKLITSDDPKGRQATDLFRGAYNKAGLTDEQAQRLNENRGGEFTTNLMLLIKKYSATNQYANEVVSSNYTYPYPGEYKEPKPIDEQVKFIAEKFGLDPTQALEYAKNMPALPEGSEGWFAVPKISAVATKHFPTIADPLQQYCEAVLMVFRMIRSTRNFSNYREGQITPNQLRQTARTLSFLEQLEAEQHGDILIITGQLGMRHRGKSVRRARETFAGNEFGFTSFMICCIVLTHPERLVRFDELDMDCAGDEFSSRAGGDFSEFPVLSFSGDEVEFDTDGVSSANSYFGSASVFAPQK